MIYTLEQIDQLTKESVVKMRSLLNIGVHIQSPAEGLFLLPKLMPSVQNKSVCMGNTSKLLPIRINHHPAGRWFSFANFSGGTLWLLQFLSL